VSTQSWSGDGSHPQSGRPLVVLSQSPREGTLRLLEQSCTVAAPDPSADADGGWPAELPEAAALLAFMSDRIDAELLDRSPRLKVVAGALKGADNIDVVACAERGVWVTVVPQLLSAATAELAVGLLLAVARRLREGDALVRAGRFDGWRRRLEGFSLRGAPVGVVGAGSLGRETIAALTALGARCSYNDPGVPSLDGVPRVPLDDLLEASRAVVVAVPLRPETVGLFDRAHIARLRPEAVLVNVGRGSTVDEAAVAAALAADRLAAYAADVFALEDESVAGRPVGVHPGLLAHPRSVFTPHLGTACTDVREAIELEAARNILEVFAGERPAGAINDPTVTDAHRGVAG
jgi:phosphonate dehydrogenase